jgi:arylsulfatase A-like enzyme
MPGRLRTATGMLLAAALLTAAVCRPPAFEGPYHVLRAKPVGAVTPRTGTLSPAGDARPALLESAAFRVPLPPHGLLTFGLGVSYAGAQEAPGWFQIRVLANGQLLADRKLNPRAALGWRDVSVPFDDLGREATLAFELRLTDRWGQDVPVPHDLFLGVAEPVIHDRSHYGRAKGVLLVSIDTLRRDHVGAYGYPRPTTPRLDALAGAGLLCEDAVSSSSWTLPAHLSLLTSADPGAHGGVDMSHGFNRRLPTLADQLKAAGFATQAVTSHLYVSATYGLDQGFDRLDFHQDRKATDVADRALDLLDRFGDRPFFVFLHFYDPHWHYDPPEATARLFAHEYTGTLTGQWQDFSRRDRGSVTAADLQHLLDLYDGEIRYVDDELGRVLDHLRARGLERNTLVAVTSDHGEEFLEHGSWEHQKTLYEEVVRIPLMMRGPGLAPRREPQQSSLLDVAPTILEWAGVAALPAAQGRSLLAPAPEREAYGETDQTDDGARRLFLRGGQGRWKAIVSLARDKDRPLREEWYDLAADPRERRSAPPAARVADDVRERALARWRAARASGKGAPAVRLTPEQREKLRALGYVGP